MILLPQLMRNIIVCSILVAICPAIANAGSLWRFGFFWSLAAATYPPSLIPWSSYTHIAQLSILPTASCGINDTSYNTKGSRANFVESAHAHGVKALISLLHDKKLKAIGDCTTPAKIDAFVAALVAHIKAYNYDGIDLDWEDGVIPAQYQDLVKRLRAAMPTMILTVDIAVHQRAYVVNIQDKIDRINLMNYDMGRTNYHGRTLKKTWHNAALRSAGDTSKYKSAEANLKYVLSSGIAPAKVNLGVPFYGYIFQGCVTGQSPPNCHTGVQRPGETFSEAGLHRSQLDYNKLLTSIFMKGALSWDDVRKAPFISYKGKTGSCVKFPCDADAFITYPDPRQMQEAVALVREKHLGGIMTFALHQEYLRNKTGDARYPLTSAIMQALQPHGQ